MKKIIIALFAVFAFSGMIMAQSDYQNHLGIRFGAGNGTSAEVSFQKALSVNRLELDLGLHSVSDIYNYINLSGFYEWTMPISGGLGWYAGVGANLGAFFYNEDMKEYLGYKNGFGLGLAGIVGVEYNFSFPLQISLDVRPVWHLVGNNDFLGFGWGGVALGVRYSF